MEVFAAFAVAKNGSVTFLGSKKDYGEAVGLAKSAAHQYAIKGLTDFRFTVLEPTVEVALKEPLYEVRTIHS